VSAAIKAAVRAVIAQKSIARDTSKTSSLHPAITQFGSYLLSEKRHLYFCPLIKLQMPRAVNQSGLHCIAENEESDW